MATIVTQAHAPWWGNLAAGVLGTLINNAITSSQQANQNAKTNALLSEAYKINDTPGRLSGLSDNAFNASTNNLLGDVINANAPTLADPNAGYNFNNNVYQQAGYNNLNYGTPAVNNGLSLAKIMQALANEPNRFKSVNMADMAKIAEPYVQEAQAARQAAIRNNQITEMQELLKGAVTPDDYNTALVTATMQGLLDSAGLGHEISYLNRKNMTPYEAGQLQNTQYANETARIKDRNDNYWKGQENALELYKYNNPYMTPFTTDTGNEIAEGAFNPRTGERGQVNIRAKGVSPKEKLEAEQNKATNDLKIKELNELARHNKVIENQFKVQAVDMADDNGNDIIGIIRQDNGELIATYPASPSKHTFENAKLALEQYKLEQQQEQNKKANELKERELSEQERSNRAKENQKNLELEVNGIDDDRKALNQELSALNNPLGSLTSNNIQIQEGREAVKKQIAELQARRTALLSGTNAQANNVNTRQLTAQDLQDIAMDALTPEQQVAASADVMAQQAQDVISSTNSPEPASADVTGKDPNGTISSVNNNRKQRPPMSDVEKAFTTPWGAGAGQTQTAQPNESKRTPPRIISQEEYETLVVYGGKEWADAVLRESNAVVGKQ